MERLRKNAQSLFRLVIEVPLPQGLADKHMLLRYLIDFLRDFDGNIFCWIQNEKIFVIHQVNDLVSSTFEAMSEDINSLWIKLESADVVLVRNRNNPLKVMKEQAKRAAEVYLKKCLGERQHAIVKYEDIMAMYPAPPEKPAVPEGRVFYCRQPILAYQLSNKLEQKSDRGRMFTSQYCKVLVLRDKDGLITTIDRSMFDRSMHVQDKVSLVVDGEETLVEVLSISDTEEAILTFERVWHLGTRAKNIEAEKTRRTNRGASSSGGYLAVPY